MRHFLVAFYFLAFVGLLVVFDAHVVLAQGQEAIIVSPSDNAVDVILKPEIEIETNFLIDSSSVSWNYGCPDSTTCVLDWPTVYLLPKLIWDSLPVYLDTIVDVDSLLPKLAIGGEYEFVNDTTLTFTPVANLAYGTEYIAIVKNLKVVVDTAVGPGGPDTIAVDEDSVLFRTVYPTHAVVAGNIGPRGLMRCSDTLAVKFNRPLSTDTSATGPIAFLKRIDSVYYNSGDTTFLPVYDTVTITTWLNAADSSVLMIDPSTLNPGDRYELRIETYRLTGDTLDNIFYTFLVKDYYEVDVLMADEDTTQSSPPGYLVSYAGKSYHAEGDVVRISAVTEDPDYAFVRWECPALPGIDEETDPTVTFTQSCTSIADVSITAVFRRIDSIQVTLVDTTDAWVMAYMFNAGTGVYVHVGGAGTYTLAPYQSLIALAGTTASSGMRFTAWQSNSPELNGVPEPRISIINKGQLLANGGSGITLEPGIGTAAGGPSCCLCTEIAWTTESGNKPGYDPSTVLSVTPSNCMSNNPNLPGHPACPVPTVVSASVTSSCVEIAGVYVLDELGAIVYNMQWPAGSGPTGWSSSAAPVSGGGTINLNLALKVPISQCPTVYFDVRPSEFNLKVFTELEDARKLDQGQVGKDRDVRISVYRIVNGKRELLGITPNENPPSSNRITFTPDAQEFTLFCDERIEVVAEYNLVEEGYTFEQWSDASGFTYPTNVAVTSFQFDMDQDREVKGIFKEYFRLRKVGVFVADATDAGSNPPTWHRPLSLGGRMLEDLNVWLSEVDDTHYGTKVHLLFNDPIDESSNGTKSSLYCLEKTERIDYPNSGSDNVTWQTRGSWGWNDWSLTSLDKEVVFSLDETSIVEGVPRGEQFEVGVGQWVANTTAERLYKTYHLTMETEMPGVEVYIESITAIDNSGDLAAPSPELYTYYGGYIISDDGVEESPKGQLPNTDYPSAVSVDDPQTYGETGDFLVVEEEKMDKYGQAALTLRSFDYDGNGGVDQDRRTQTFLEEDNLIAVWVGVLAIAAGFYIGVQWGVNTGNEQELFKGTLTSILGVLLVFSAGLGFPAVLLSAINVLYMLFTHIFENEDDPMGDYSWFYGWQPSVWFGAHPYRYAEQHRPRTENNKIGYDVKFELKK